MATEKRRYVWRGDCTERLTRDDPRTFPLIELLGLDPDEVSAREGIAVSYTLLRIVEY